MTDSNPYLGVSKSLSGRFWLERSGDERLGLAISQRCQVPEIIGRMLAARGLVAGQRAGFLEPAPARRVARSFRTQGHGSARRRASPMRSARVSGSRSSATMMWTARPQPPCCRVSLRSRSAPDDPLLYVPDRMREGYGPNAAAFHSLKAAGAALVVTVDCGITAFAAVGRSRRVSASMSSSPITMWRSLRCPAPMRWSIPIASTRRSLTAISRRSA